MSVKGQLDKTKKLILEQWQRTVGGKVDAQIEAAREALLEEQFEDLGRDVHEEAQVVGARKASTRGLLKHLIPRDRAIYICKISGAFTDKEIGAIFKVSPVTVYRVAKMASQRSE